MPGDTHPPIYAHRFGSDYGPESSRSALEHTLSGDVDGIEADIVLSGDDRVLARHDPILSYSTDLTGWVQVLEVIPRDLPFQLDVKAYADHELARRTAERACEVMREHGTAARAEVISFFSGACEAASAAGLRSRLIAWSDYAPEALAEWVVGHGMIGVSFEGFILSERVVRPLHDAGLTISVGAVNKLDQVRKLEPLRVDILVSDRPHELRSELADG